MLAGEIGETHVVKFLMFMGINPPSRQYLKDREREVGWNFEELATETCKELIEKEITLIQGSHPSEGNSEPPVISLSASIDAAWQSRGSGRSYQSTSGHSALIGDKPGKVLSFATRKKICRSCGNDEKQTMKAIKHDCHRNWAGSAKAMESSMAVQLLKETSGTNYQIGQIDSSTGAKIRNSTDRTVERRFDSNHIMKMLSTQLHQQKEKHAELSSAVITYFRQCFVYAIKQNKDSAEKITAAANNIVNHAFGEHKNCNDNWCTYLKDSKGYKHLSLFHEKDLKGGELRKSLTSLFAGYASNAEKLTKLGSTKKMKVSIILSLFCSNSSESFDFRVSVAVCKKNLGQEYCVHLLNRMKLPVNPQVALKAKTLFNAARKRKLQQETVQFKRRRLALKKNRKSNNEVQELQEGHIYGSGIELRRHNEIDDEIIAPFQPVPPEKRSKLEENFSFMSVDVETTSAGRFAEIVELSAVTSSSEFDQYVLP